MKVLKQINFKECYDISHLIMFLGCLIYLALAIVDTLKTGSFKYFDFGAGFFALFGGSSIGILAKSFKKEGSN